MHRSDPASCCELEGPRLARLLTLLSLSSQSEPLSSAGWYILVNHLRTTRFANLFLFLFSAAYPDRFTTRINASCSYSVFKAEREKRKSNITSLVPDSSISSSLIRPTFQCKNCLCSSFRRWRFIFYYFLSQSQLGEFSEGQLSRAWEGPSLLRVILSIGIGIGIISGPFGDRYFLDLVMNTTWTFCVGMGFQSARISPTYRINRLYLSLRIIVTGGKRFSPSQ